MDVEIINARVERALEANQKAQSLLIYFAAALFILGLLTTIVAFWLKNRYVLAGSLVIDTLLLLPFLEIRKLRRENVALQTLPALICPLPPGDAARQIIETLKYLRG